MILREYTPKDVSGWVKMRKELWPDATSDMHSLEIRLITDRPEHATVIVLVDDTGTVRGFAEVSIRARVDGSLSEQVGYLEGWYVQEPHRGQGWGKKMIGLAETWVGSKGFTELASDAELSNERSIAAHHSAGFRETFRLVHFIKHIGQEASDGH